MRNLAEVGTGETVVISHIEGSGPFRARLSEMGFVCGKTVKRLGCSPIGNPIVFELMGSQIALRKSEARKIRVTGADETVHQTATRQATTEAQVQTHGNTNTSHGMRLPELRPEKETDHDRHA